MVVYSTGKQIFFGEGGGGGGGGGGREREKITMSGDTEIMAGYGRQNVMVWQ